MMNCGCEKTEKKPSGGEPVMYIGDGVTTEFPIPFGHTGDMVSIKTPHCGISVRVERDCGYQVVDGVVKFITPPPSGTVISFTRDGCPIHARGEWDATKIYRTGDIVTFNDVGYYAKDTSCGVQPSSDSEKWFVVSGLSGTIQIGTVTTGEAGTPASVTNRGTERDAILDFVIPGGSRGEKGDRGEATPQYNTVAEMIADLSIKKGSYVMTGGYYSPGDKGACFYRITDTSGDLKIRLGNGLYAEIADTEITSGKLGIIGTNNAQLIQTAFDQLKRFVIDTDITLQHEVNMHRDNSTLIIRDAAIKYTGSEEAAFHVYGSGNYIIGEGRATISGPGKSSLCAGILLGGESKTRNVLSNLIKNLGIGGFGTGISMYNHQVSDNAVVYFNQISDMYISSCTNGILFTGYANAEIVTNIIFWNVGNANNDGGAIVFKNIGGSHPLDNNISHIFHHASGGATTLNIESASYSVFSHIVCEQGGWAHSLYITQGSSACIYELISNVSAFRILPAGFEDSQNTITDITGIASCAVSTPRLSGRKYFSRSRERTPASLTRYYNAQPGEGVKFPVLIFKTDGSVKVPVIVKIKAYSGTHHNIDFLQRTSEKTIIISTSTDGYYHLQFADYGCDNLDYFTIEGNILYFRTGYNGTKVTCYTTFEVEECTTVSGFENKSFTTDSEWLTEFTL